MIGKLFESLYLKVYVGIVVTDSQITVHVELYSKKTLVNSAEENFKTTELDDRLYDFISLYTNESPYHYVSILDSSSSQGAIPTCSYKEMSNFIDLDSSKSISFDDKWTYYTSKDDLKTIQKKYEKVGIDFVFSPFVVLAKFFKDKIDTHTAMYILVEKNSLSISIFDSSELLYAEYIDMENAQESDELIMEDDEISDDMDFDLDGSVDLEEIDVIDDIESLDDFGDIEDLDSLEEIDEFSEARDIEEEFSHDEEEYDISDVDEDGFNDDYQRFSSIQTSVNYFYNDRRYSGKFVETVYIADSVGVSSDLKRYLEEEMFLSVYIRKIDLAVEVTELTKAEVR